MAFENAEVIGDKLAAVVNTDLVAVGTVITVLDVEVTVVATDVDRAGKRPCQPCSFRTRAEHCSAAPRCTKVGDPSQYVHFVATKDFHNPYRFIEDDAE